MSDVLRISIRFLDPVPEFHGRRDGGQPEWPPSPLRLFQALVDAAASRWREPRKFVEYARPALEWLQRKHPFEIVTPSHHVGTSFRIAVPNNDCDSPAKIWSKGGEAIKPHRPIDLKTMKTVSPVRLMGTPEYGNVLHYLYSIADGHPQHIDTIAQAARSITHFGWGIDMAFGDAKVISTEQASQLLGHRWKPSPRAGTPMRTPTIGTLDDLARKHTDFLGRLTDGGYRPVPPLRVFSSIRYRRDTDPLPRPYAVFKLRDSDDDTYSHPQSKLIHIAGMVRHLAIDAMKRNPPPSVDDPAAWVERYVAGHRDATDKSVDLPHSQLSYVPIPSIGFHHTDPSIRRVMIIAPVGDHAILKHLRQQLDGLRLKSEREQDLRGPVFLHHAVNDKVAKYYIEPSTQWASVTPVILPGHDDHKPDKTRKLIEKALVQSGIDQPCTFEWSAFSHFPKSFSAHKYDKDKRPIGYLRPDHLLDQTAVHLELTFANGIEVPGPLTLGAGRHCGFGLMAAVNNA